ncbi:MAG: IPTL-CTERM sorting domain-containing protein [Burkholderiaceae bacterium]|nr:IPTL-CTERM sorting domain-containing protein [Burkholderiaceae bacterium]
MTLTVRILEDSIFAISERPVFVLVPQSVPARSMIPRAGRLQVKASPIKKYSDRRKSGVVKKTISTLAAGTALACTPAAWAGFTVTVQQTSSGVVATGAGSFDTTVMAADGSTRPFPQDRWGVINGGTGIDLIYPGSRIDRFLDAAVGGYYQGEYVNYASGPGAKITIPKTLLGPMGSDMSLFTNFTASSSSGDPVYVMGSMSTDDRVMTAISLAPGYVSGAPLSNETVWAGKTYVDLNMVPGTYTVGWSDAAATPAWSEFFTVNILPSKVSVSCTPASLIDSGNSVSTCTITTDIPLPQPLSVNLTPPADNPRYQTTCASPWVIPAKATSASCTITAVGNTVAGDGDVTASIALLDSDASSPIPYTVATRSADVQVRDDDVATPPPATATPTPVPTLGEWALILLSAAVAGLTTLRLRKRPAVHKG